MIFILNNRGTTIIETLAAFSIFISVIILFVSLYHSATSKNVAMSKEYQVYQEKNQIKEQQLCLENQLSEIIQQVLH